MTAAATRMAKRQGEYVSLLVLRLNAQAKGGLNALRRAAREGELAPSVWRRFAAVLSSRKDLVSGPECNDDSIRTKDPIESEAEYATFQDQSSRNALICVEPWRCRLPVVQTDSPRDPLAPRG